MNLLKSLFGNSSKKLVVFIVTSVLIVLKDYFQFSAEQVQGLEILAGTYLVSQGVADFSKGAAQVESKKEKS